eukprot:gene8734-9622_t
MSISSELNEEQLKAIYAWVDGIPLSRPKRNMARDFSDGVLLAEVISAYFPQLVELHNYTAANSLKHKVYNLETLNARVLKRLGYTIPRQLIEDIANCKSGAVEQVLNALQYKMAKFREGKGSISSPPTGGAGAGGRSDRTVEGSEDPRQPRLANNHLAGANSNASNNSANIRISIDQNLLLEKEQQIRELQENVEILELKVAKLEQLLRLKDAKIQKLMSGNIN